MNESTAQTASGTSPRIGVLGASGQSETWLARMVDRAWASRMGLALRLCLEALAGYLLGPDGFRAPTDLSMSSSKALETGRHTRSSDEH